MKYLKHSWNACPQAIPQDIAYSWKSQKNRPRLIFIPFKIYLESFPIQKLFIFLVFSLSLHKCRKSLSKTTLMSLDWKIMDQTMLPIIHFSWRKLYRLKEERFKSFFDMIFYCKQACKLPLNYASYWKAKTLFCTKFLRPHWPVCVLVKMVTLRPWLIYRRFA